MYRSFESLFHTPAAFSVCSSETNKTRRRLLNVGTRVGERTSEDPDPSWRAYFPLSTTSKISSNSRFSRLFFILFFFPRSLRELINSRKEQIFFAYAVFYSRSLRRRDLKLMISAYLIFIQFEEFETHKESLSFAHLTLFVRSRRVCVAETHFPKIGARAQRHGWLCHLTHLSRVRAIYLRRERRGCASSLSLSSALLRYGNSILVTTTRCGGRSADNTYVNANGAIIRARVTCFYTRECVVRSVEIA